VRTTPKGTLTVYSHCKACKREAVRAWMARPGVREKRAERARERYQQRRKDPEAVEATRERDRAYRQAYRERYPEREKEASRRWRERMMEDEERHAHYLAGRRIGQRIAVERVTGDLAGASRERDASDAYRLPSKAETVSADPLRRYVLARFPGWALHEIVQVAGRSVSDKLLSRVLREHAHTIELDAADRFLTRGLGRPDLLLALYPPEAT
jgi:hypothetical protein